MSAMVSSACPLKLGASLSVSESKSLRFRAAVTLKAVRSFSVGDFLGRRDLRKVMTDCGWDAAGRGAGGAIVSVVVISITAVKHV